MNTTNNVSGLFKKRNRVFEYFKGKHSIFQRIITLLMYILLFDLVFVFIYPFLYMIITSLKSPQDLTDISVKWILNVFYIDNYKLAIQVLNYPSRLLNSVLVTSMALVGHVISCAFIGYGFARFKFKGRNFFFASLILYMIVPVQTVIVPVYLIFSKLGWVGTYLPIIAPSFLGFGLMGPLFIFLFRQFFLSLPKSLEEAAYIDGCGPIKTFFKIAFPSSISSILVCIVLGMVWQWNDVFEPSVYLVNQKMFLLPQMLPGLYDLIQQYSTSVDVVGDIASKSSMNEALVMAATTLTVLPILFVYFFLQKRFMESVETSGITGE